MHYVETMSSETHNYMCFLNHVFDNMQQLLLIYDIITYTSLQTETGELAQICEPLG